MNSNLSNIIRFRFCFNTAKFFFLIGSILFLIQLLIQEFTFITIIGLYYILFAVLVNLLLVLMLLIALFIDNNKFDTLKSIGILSANIPIAMIYASIIIY